MTGKGVVGPWTGKALKIMPSTMTTWREWRARHPETTVLKPPHPVGAYRSTNQAYDRYRRGGKPWKAFLGKAKIDDRFPPMTPVTIVPGPGGVRVYPHPSLKDGTTRDGDLVLTKKGATVTVTNHDGKPVPTIHAYWFAANAFYTVPD